MKSLEILKIDQGDICNLSRLPIDVFLNPVYLTTKQILKNSNIKYQDTHLFSHYRIFSKKIRNLSDIFKISESSILDSYSYKSYFFPWYHEDIIDNFEDIAFIKERYKGFGSEQFEKIKLLIKSIQNTGYTPELYADRKHGHITGYWLSGVNGKRFYIVSGNHRASILCAMFPKDKIPVIYERVKFMKSRDRNKCLFYNEHPSTFSIEDSDKWPSVVNGIVSNDIARKIFNAYVRE
jgi:hypothetical protein